MTYSVFVHGNFADVLGRGALRCSAQVVGLKLCESYGMTGD
jgi:hypothetical protein